MPLPLNRSAYADCYELFDRALASKKGVRKRCESSEAAFYLRNRLNKARTLDARLNKQVYQGQMDHPLYADSIYYKVTIRVAFDADRNAWFCSIEKNEFEESDVEEIEPWEEEIKSEPPQVESSEEFNLAEEAKPDRRF